MKIVVDTNIVFSAMLNSQGNIGKILIHAKNKFQLTKHLRGAKLWTGDKRLTNGLAKKGFKKIVTTQELNNLLEKSKK